jgi:bifunctional UDP-N-acetylglucosamine pyrophosphorylase/glucosamine-1-phosphate N-acetyltransferase
MNQIVILAAGKGTRMGSELPKVLVSLKGKPMINYLMESVMSVGVDCRPIIVVSPDNKEIIKEALVAYDLEYVIQDKQLGTGHAVACARDFINQTAENVLVLYGDQPLLTTDSIKKFIDLKPEALTIMSTVLPNFEDWYYSFYRLGRIVHHELGGVKAIVEFKDATEEEKTIKEINLASMAFNKDWLLKNIGNLKDDNNAHEFYLTDLVKIAFSQGYKINTVSINPKEAMGINSQEELKIAESLI